MLLIMGQFIHARFVTPARSTPRISLVTIALHIMLYQAPVVVAVPPRLPLLKNLPRPPPPLRLYNARIHVLSQKSVPTAPEHIPPELQQPIFGRDAPRNFSPFSLSFSRISMDPESTKLVRSWFQSIGTRISAYSTHTKTTWICVCVRVC